MSSSTLKRYDFGCSHHKKEGFIGVDLFPGSAADIVADLTKDCPEIPDNSADEIYCAHVLEHIPNPYHYLLLRQIVRVLKPGAPFELRFPHPGADMAMVPDHKHCFSRQYIDECIRTFPGMVVDKISYTKTELFDICCAKFGLSEDVVEALFRNVASEYIVHGHKRPMPVWQRHGGPITHEIKHEIRRQQENRAFTPWRHNSGAVLQKTPDSAKITKSDANMAFGFTLRLAEDAHFGWTEVLQIGDNSRSARATVFVQIINANTIECTVRFRDNIYGFYDPEAVFTTTAPLAITGQQDLSVAVQACAAKGSVRVLVGDAIYETNLSPWSWTEATEIWLGSCQLAADVENVWLSPTPLDVANKEAA